MDTEAISSAVDRQLDAAEDNASGTQETEE